MKNEECGVRNEVQDSRKQDVDKMILVLFMLRISAFNERNAHDYDCFPYLCKRQIAVDLL